MDDKPKFGIDADETEDDKRVEGDSTGIKHEDSNINRSTENTDTEKPRFGTQAQTEQTHSESKFGADSVDSSTQQDPKSMAHWFKSIFSMQPASFWLKQYVFAIIGYFMVAGGVYSEGGKAFLLVDLLLYPFTVTILQEIGRNSKSKRSTLNSFFFGFSVGAIGDSWIWIAIYAIIRWLIFMFKFMFSIIIGAIGLFYMVSQAKKLNL